MALGYLVPRVARRGLGQCIHSGIEPVDIPQHAAINPKRLGHTAVGYEFVELGGADADVAGGVLAGEAARGEWLAARRRLSAG
jgi:hypothetical protein